MPPLDYAEPIAVAGEASSSILGQTVGFTLATVADFGTSIWNSLPMTPEVGTEDILAKVSKDALAVYNEHPDAVHTASLIGGSLAPGGLALKLLGRARRGVTALGYSTGESSVLGNIYGAVTGGRQLALESELQAAFRSAGPGTAEYEKLSRQLYLAHAVQQVADNAVIELAVVGALNAHPYLEDYKKDPLSNFALSMLVGGVLGAGLAIPATNRAVFNALKEIPLKNLNEILDTPGIHTSIPLDLTNTAQVQRATANIKVYQSLLDMKVPENLAADPYRGQVLQTLIYSDSKKREEAIIRMFPTYETANADVKNIVNTILSDPNVIGVDQMKFINMNKIDKVTSKVVTIAGATDSEALAVNPLVQAIILEAGPANTSAIKAELLKQGFTQGDVAKILGEVIPRSFTKDGKAMVAFARLGPDGNLQVLAAKGAKNAATGADIVGAEAAVNAAARDKTQATIVQGFEDDNVLRYSSSAEVNLRFLKELKKIDALNDQELAYVLVAPDDLARQSALVSVLNKKTAAELDKINIKITSNYPEYAAVQSFLTKTVGKNYEPNLIRITEDRNLTFDTHLAEKIPSLSLASNKAASEMLDDWVHGKGAGGSIDEGKARLRRAFDNFFRKTRLPAGETGNGHVAERIWLAGAKFREELAKIADPDGYVYLARGVRSPVVGASSVESFSAKYSISQGFGSANYYKIHVNNVIGSLGSGRLREAEILVGSPHHEIVNGIPTETGATVKANIPTTEKKNTLTAESFMAMHSAETERQAKRLMQEGYSMEEVSSRTNVTRGALEFIQLNGHLTDFATNGDWRIYKDADKIHEYVSAKNKFFAVYGNPLKNALGEALNKLDNQFGSIAHMQHIAALTYDSGSEIANRVLSIYADKGTKVFINELNTSLAEINNIHVGDPRWQSADNALRKLITGPTITFLGKQIINANDALIDKFITPIAEALLPLKDKPLGLYELNTTMNKLAELRGWREVRTLDDGTHTIVRREAQSVFDPATGKMVKQLVEVPITNKDGSMFTIKQQEVMDFLNSTRTLKEQLYVMHNLNNTLQGSKHIEDLGFWLPPLNLVNKNFAFVIDPKGKENVRLLVATRASELESLIHAFNQTPNGKNFNVVRKGEQESYNIMKGYTDYEAYTTYANVAFEHKGASALAIPPHDDRMVTNIIQGYQNLILQSARKYSESYLADSMQWLDKMSEFNRRSIAKQPKEKASEEYIKDSAMTVKNIILGRDQLEQSPMLKRISTQTDAVINWATNVINQAANIASLSKGGTMEAYARLGVEARRIGIPHDLLGGFQQYVAASTPQTKDISHAVISAGNGLTATLMLRMLEVAQPLVNILSLPILTSSALMEKLPRTVLNAEGDSMVFPLRQMNDGIRGFFNPVRKDIEKTMWEPMGLVNQPVRKYMELLETVHRAPFGKQFSEKALDLINDFQTSKLIKDYLAVPSDWAEQFTRSLTMHTGFDAAKRAYPGISNMGATIMATNFSDRAIGNYYAAQRPTLFQGSFGAGLGLFQTYFLTFAQSIYRGLEERNFKQLATLMLGQTGMFGMASWPGYNLLSENIVSHFSDKHFDLTTGTYRAVGDTAAEIALYGLPSSLGPALYTRGDISPRIPSTTMDFAAVNAVKEGFSSMYRIIKKVGEGIPNGQGTQGLFEALSLQSLNRPIARWSELVTGHSITRQENTVSPTSEVWSPLGIAARLMSTRPLQEQVTRNAIHLNQYYRSMDQQNRDDIVGRLKTAVRNGVLTDDILGAVAMDYLRHGGTADGWRSSLNHVLVDSPEGARMGLLRKLHQDTPLNQMINDTY